MSSTKSGHKKIFLINRDFQLRYTRGAAFVGLISTLLTCILILYPLYHFRILRIANFVPLPFLIGIGIAALVNIGFIVFMGIRLTHRIAGPMFSLVREMREIGSGRVMSQMTVRKDDELKYVVRNFNDMTDGLKRVLERDIQDIDEIENLLETKSEDDGVKAKDVIVQLKTRMQDRLSTKAQAAETTE